jgi:hypothetical protein
VQQYDVLIFLWLLIIVLWLLIFSTLPRNR